MSNSSYQTLARYDDCACRHKASGLGDIRQKHREVLCEQRVGRRHRKHLLNRKVISESDTSDYGSPDVWPYDTLDAPTSSCDTNSNDLWGLCHEYDDEDEPATSWGQPASYASRSDTSSPSLSVNSSDYSPVHSDMFRLSTPSLNNSPTLQSRSKPVSRRQLLLTRKQIQAAHYSSDTVQGDFEQYVSNIGQIATSKEQMSAYISSGVELLSNAISCTNQKVSDQAMYLLISLVEQDLLEIQTIYFILQQGILFNIKKSLIRQSGCQLSLAIRLFSTVIKKEPRSVSFISELLFTIQLFPLLDEVMSYGAREDSYPSFELYTTLYEALQIQMKTESEPILSDQSGSKDTAAYSSRATLRRIIRQPILEIYIERHLKQAEYIDDHLLKMSMGSIIQVLHLNYLQLRSAQPDVELARGTIESLTKADLVGNLQALIGRAPASERISPATIEDIKEFVSRYTEIMRIFGGL